MAEGNPLPSEKSATSSDVLKAPKFGISSSFPTAVVSSTCSLDSADGREVVNEVGSVPTKLE